MTTPTNSDPKSASKRFPMIAALIGAGAAGALATDVTKWEGIEYDPYKDIVGVWTVCVGDTYNVGPNTPRQTQAQCDARLDRQLVNHTAPVLKCTPGLKDRPWQLRAAASLAYNIGTSGYCRSSAARHFNAKRWRQGCDAIKLWNKAGGRVVRGLVNRRAYEHRICITDL